MVCKMAERVLSPLAKHMGHDKATAIHTDRARKLIPQLATCPANPWFNVLLYLVFLRPTGSPTDA